MNPTDKSPAIEEVLNNILGASRKVTIQCDMCIPKPIGCGQPVGKFKEKTSDINIKKTEFYLDKSVAIYIENRDTVRQNFYSLSEYNLLKDSTTKYQLITYLSIFNKELFYHIEIKNPVFYNRKLFKNHIINKKEI